MRHHSHTVGSIAALSLRWTGLALSLAVVSAIVLGLV